MQKLFFTPTVRFLLLIGFLIGLWFLGQTLNIDLDHVHAWLAQYPLWLSGLLYIIIYVGVTTLLWFGTIDFFRITGALLFGPYVSAALVYIAEICNASILFMVSRKLGREFVVQKFKLKSQDLQYAKSNTGFRWALALRMNLLVPYRFMDIGFGLTKVFFTKYFLAIVLGSPARILLVQLFIAGIGDVLFKKNVTPQELFNVLSSYFPSHPGVLIFGLLNFLAVIILTIIALVMSMLRKQKATT